MNNETILVIEDEERVRGPLVDILEVEGFKVIQAENGAMGVEKAAQQLPDLILCDIRMPEKNGYQVLIELRNNPETATIPFIFLTAKTAKEDIRRGMEYGADDYITKPFQIPELVSAIRARLEKYALLSSRQVDELRTQISLMLPHELRTPLTTILGYSQLLRENPMFLEDSDIVTHMIDGIYEGGKQLQRLIENFLLFSRLTVVGIDDVDLKAWTDKVSTDLQSFIQDHVTTIAQKGHRDTDLVLDIANIATTVSNQALLKILEEVMDNAMKFSDPGTPIEVRVVENEGVTVLQVADHGLGMEPSQLKNLGAFVQFDRSFYEQAGSGLGLSIVKLLTNMNDIKLDIQSEVDKGTTVTFQIQN